VDSTGEYNGCFQQVLLVQKKEEEKIDRQGTRALWKTSRLVLEQSSKT